MMKSPLRSRALLLHDLVLVRSLSGADDHMATIPIDSHLFVASFALSMCLKELQPEEGRGVLEVRLSIKPRDF